MLERIRRPLERLGHNFIDGIWRIGVMTRFFALVIAVVRIARAVLPDRLTVVPQARRFERGMGAARH